MAEYTHTSPPPATTGLGTPLWQVRMRLLMRSLRTNLALFAENPVGLVVHDGPFSLEDPLHVGPPTA